MLRPTVGWYKAPIRGLRPDIFSVRNTEYVWQLRSSFRGTPSLTRGRVCLLYVLLALASAVFLGRRYLGLATVFYCLRFETPLFVASYDSQGHGGGIRPRLFFYNHFAQTQRKTVCIVDEACLSLRCLAVHFLLLSRAEAKSCLPSCCLAIIIFLYC
jgi:hypothetical protein